MKDLIQYISEYKNKTPNSTFISSQFRNITYKEAYQKINTIAYNLKNLLDQSNSIGLLGEEIPEYVLSYYGILKSKNIAALLPHHKSNKTISTLTKHANINTIIYTDSYNNKIEKIENQREKPFKRKIVIGEDTSSDYSIIEFLNDSKQKDLFTRIALDDEALILFTSGMTGFPKGVVYSHKNIMKNIRSFSKVIDPLKNLNTVSSLPDYNFISNILALNTTLVKGGTIILSDSKDIEQLTKTISQQKGSLFLSTSHIYKKIYNNITNKHYLDSLSLCLSFGNSLENKFISSWKDTFECDILEGYGATEFPAITFNRLDSESKINSVGTLLPGLEVKIADKNGAKTNIGETGELIIKKNSHIPDYLLPSQKSNSNWINTGDLFQKDIDGYLYYKGRKKDLISRYGFKISPGKIRATMLSFNKIKDVFVLKLKGDRNDQIKLCIVPKRNKSLNKKDVFDYAKQNLPKYLAPDFVEFYENLPRNKIGKIERNKLL